MTIDINDILKRRGILQAAADAGWQPDGSNAWAYPVFDLDDNEIGTRLRFAVPSKMKYAWKPGKPDNTMADWYILRDTKEAIRRAGGVCYLANGEPALLAYHAAGVKNVIATTLSEISVPGNLKDVLTALGVKTLVNIRDKDDAGFNASQNWKGALLRSDVTYISKQWPEYLDDKSDANDAWIYASFDRAAFLQLLQECETELLPEKESPKQRFTASTDFVGGGHNALVEAMRSALEGYDGGVFTGKTHQGNTWLEMRCIFHDDEHSSAGFSLETGTVNCFACGTHKPREVAEALGINPYDYWNPLPPTPPTPPAASRPKPRLDAAPDAISDKIIQMPDALTEEQRYERMAHYVEACHWRYLAGEHLSWFPTRAIPSGFVQALLNLAEGQSKVYIVWGRMHEAMLDGRLDWSAFTVQDVMNAIDMTYNATKQGMELLERWGFLRLLGTVFKKELLPQITDKNPGGRPPALYTLVTDGTWLDSVELALETLFRERFHVHSIDVPSFGVKQQLGLSADEYEALVSKSKAMQYEAINKRAARELHKELHGDGYNWQGWRFAIASSRCITLDWMSLNNSKEVRMEMAAFHVQHQLDTEGEAINTRTELQRVLGCTDQTVTNVLKAAGIESDKRHTTVKLKNNISDIDQHIIEAQQQHRGKVVHVRFRYKDAEGKPAQLVSYEHQWYGDFTKFQQSNRLIDITLHVQLPSKQRFATDEELEDAKADDLFAHTEKVQAETNAQAKAKDAISKPKKQRKAPKGEPEVDVPHDWLTHTDSYLWKQVALQVHVWTDKRLEDSTLYDDTNAVLQEFEQPIEATRWLLKNAASDPIRSTESYSVSGNALIAEAMKLGGVVSNGMHISKPQPKPKHKAIPITLQRPGRQQDNDLPKKSRFANVGKGA